LEQTFTAHMPFLVATSDFGYGRIILEFSVVLPAPSPYPLNNNSGRNLVQ